MVQASLALFAALLGVFYFSWVVIHDLRHSDTSHTHCAPRATRHARPGTFWLIVTLSAALALVFVGLALEAVYRVLEQL